MRTTSPFRILGYLAVALGVVVPCGSAYAFSHENSGEPIQVPVADSTGHQWLMQGRVCRPVGKTLSRLVIINHGSPASSKDRPGMTLASCESESVQWFVHRHYAVVLVLRLGYGATGGPWSEGYGGFDSANFVRAGLETARQIQAVVDYSVTLPQADPTGVIVVGQSAGGWGTVAYDSVAHPHVAAFINMAGGRGGHYRDQRDSNCHPEKLVAAAAEYGKTASTPMLWIYSKNDSFFNTELASSMYEAYTRGGGTAAFITARSFGTDGHHLFGGRGGSEIWGPILAAYIDKVDPVGSVANDGRSRNQTVGVHNPAY